MSENLPETGKNAAVICELNPLHLGHRWLFQQVKEAGMGLVCILSGNFVQRGEPAILDKWSRARLALENGADLVLELPLPWACAGAERFAAGGVCLAAALGNVEVLAFGSESVDLSLIEQTARALLSTEFSARLSSLPDTGETFAKRREAVLAEMLGEQAAALLRSPNAILAVEYQKALLRQGSDIRPMAYPRQGAAHDKQAGKGELASAGQLRELLRQSRSLAGLVPESTGRLLGELTAQGRCPADISLLERSILCKLRTMTLQDFSRLPDVSEGLENRLFQAARQAGSLEEFYGIAKSRRYTLARLRRLALAAFLGITADLPQLPPVLRVLGMNERGEGILRTAAPALPVAVRPADFQRLGGEALRVFELEARADDLYAMAFPKPLPCGRDYTEKLVKT